MLTAILVALGIGIPVISLLGLTAVGTAVTWPLYFLQFLGIIVFTYMVGELFQKLSTKYGVQASVLLAVMAVGIFVVWFDQEQNGLQQF